METVLLDGLSPQTLLQWNQMLYDAGAAVSTLDMKHTALKRSFSYLEQFVGRDRAGRLSSGRLNSGTHPRARTASYALSLARYCLRNFATLGAITNRQ